MGKYMKKAKFAGKPPVGGGGVCTRARTLALQQHLQISSSTYLQLRSRRLKKPFPVVNRSRNPNLCSKSKMSPKYKIVPQPSAPAKSVTTMTAPVSEEMFKKNTFDFDSRKWNENDTTPCSSVGGSEGVKTPANSVVWNVPTADEMEEFFSSAERLQLRLFEEKYNYDPVNDCPLPGRFEWSKLDT